MSEVRTFIEAAWRVAGGGTVPDREVVSTLTRETPRRSNAAIARELVVMLSAVEKHISSIFTRLGLPATDDHHRRALAVLAYLRATGWSRGLNST